MRPGCIWALALWVLTSSAAPEGLQLLCDIEHATRRLEQLQRALLQALIAKRGILFAGGVHSEPDPPNEDPHEASVRSLVLDEAPGAVEGASVVRRVSGSLWVILSENSLTVYDGGGKRLMQESISLRGVHSIATLSMGEGVLALVTHPRGASCVRLSRRGAHTTAHAILPTSGTDADSYIDGGSARFIVGGAAGSVYILSHECRVLGRISVGQRSITQVVINSQHLVAVIASGARVHLLRLDRLSDEPELCHNRPFDQVVLDMISMPLSDVIRHYVSS